MSITRNSIEEQLSIAYATAVVARAGAAFDEITHDYGIDAEVSMVDTLPNGDLQPTGYSFYVALKASKVCAEEDDHIVYDMKVEHYNKLARFQGNSPIFLVLLRLPPDENDWLLTDEKQLLLRYCCYWMRVGRPLSTNSSTQRVRIPRTQVFNPSTVQALLQGVRTNEFTCDHTQAA